MLLASSEDVYITDSGYIAQHADRKGLGLKTKEQEEEEDDEFDEQGNPIKADIIGKAEEKKKKKKAALALAAAEVNPLADPSSCCLRAACLNEDNMPPPADMPPIWMKSFAIAPAPRIPGPDPPLREEPMQGTQSAWNTATSFGGSQMAGGAGGHTMNSFGMNQTGGMSQAGGGRRGKKKTEDQMRSSKVKFADAP